MMPKLLTRIGSFIAFCAALVPLAAHGRTLEQIKAKGAISLCANPDALPYASAKADPPGFQIEIARALAQGLGVSLEQQWIMPRYRANLVNCDILLDSISDPALYEGKLLLSRPYQRSGIALGVGSSANGVQGFGDLQKGQKVGVMVGSLASVVLGKRGLTTSPYSFEQDILDDLARGDLYGAAVAPATLAYYVHQHPQSGMRLIPVYDKEPELTWTVSVGMRKADQALVDAVNRVLDRLLEDGTITAIYARYGIEHQRP
ncbi:MAG: ABC transporter substrate-binding protein [Proteobacteria bacterium]|nr:MAG: ABC transporter substrate-binding protein [Pseudomonadota bacterium]